MSGSSGAIYGIRLLEVLATMPDVETHLVVSPAARQTIALETDRSPRDVERLAHTVHKHADVAAAPSSGSFRTAGMIVVPCSVRTVGSIAWSIDDNLLTRAADVTLKERRRLVLAVRETPLHLGHLRAMTQVTEMGAIVAPLTPAFYGRPATIEQLVDHQVGRLLDLLDISPPEELVTRWEGAAAARTDPDDGEDPPARRA
jgi:4-hydroxy-3-polyprenylbenzoate decarboxylase